MTGGHCEEISRCPIAASPAGQSLNGWSKKEFINTIEISNPLRE
jgi:hypothetical protein